MASIPTSINPDADIKVETVLPNGRLTRWSEAGRDGVRRKIFSIQYPNYGQARLAAQEFEELQRKLRKLKEIR